MFHSYSNPLAGTKDYISKTWSSLDLYQLTPARPTFMCQMFLVACQQQVSVTPETNE